MDKPFVRNKSGRKVYPGFENEDYYFFQRISEELADDYHKQLTEAGYKAHIGRDTSTRYFVGVKKEKPNE